jgi:hypothetical protein
LPPSNCSSALELCCLYWHDSDAISRPHRANIAETRSSQPCGPNRRDPCIRTASGVSRRRPSPAVLPLSRPVTPEVAGSSPVAPVENILQISVSVAGSGAIDRRLSNRPRAHPARESWTQSGHVKRCKLPCSVVRARGQSLRSSRADPASGWLGRRRRPLGHLNSPPREGQP